MLGKTYLCAPLIVSLGSSAKNREQIMTKRDSAESFLFTWDNWDAQGYGHFTFYDCVLIQCIGDVSRGTKVPFINVDYEKSTIHLLDEKGIKTKSVGFRLKLEH